MRVLATDTPLMVGVQNRVRTPTSQVNLGWSLALKATVDPDHLRRALGSAFGRVMFSSRVKHLRWWRDGGASASPRMHATLQGSSEPLAVVAPLAGGVRLSRCGTEKEESWTILEAQRSTVRRVGGKMVPYRHAWQKQAW